jgi:hypothetical protein
VLLRGLPALLQEVTVDGDHSSIVTVEAEHRQAVPAGRVSNENLVFYHYIATSPTESVYSPGGTCFLGWAGAI